MRLDKFKQTIFNEQDIFDLIYENDIESLENVILENSINLQNFNTLLNNKLISFQNINYEQTLEEFDKKNQSQWFMPEEYHNFDIEGYLAYQCPKQNYQRLIEELSEFRKRNMYDLLRWLKYFVDICRKNNVVWGVGRGSSVASYTLFLLGVHKIDSIKYKLDWQEFLR